MNLLMHPNHCTSIQNQTFIKLFQHSVTDKVGKHNPLEDLYSQGPYVEPLFDVLGILIILRVIYCNQYQCIYLKNEQQYFIAFLEST